MVDPVRSNAALLSRPRPAGTRRAVLVIAVFATLGHTAVTAVAAPLNFSQRDHTGDPATLTQIFDEFAQLTLLRAALQTVALVALAWIVLTRQAPPGHSTTAYRDKLDHDPSPATRLKSTIG